MAQQMTPTEIGILYDTISDELDGGVTRQNMRSIQRRDPQHSRFGDRSSAHRT